MSQALIRRAFESALQTWANAQTPPIPIAFENVTFTPPALGGRYLRAFLLPAATGSDDLQGVHRRYEGVFQVSIVTPLNKGPGPAEALAAAIAALYSPETQMVVSGLRVYVITPMSPAAGIPEDDAYVVPMSCQYRADTI